MTKLRTASVRVRRATFRPRCEALEDRQMLTTYWVNNIGDGGLGALRTAILNANANPGMDDIQFIIPGIGVHTIQPLSPLPEITDALIIDGYTQPGASPNTLAVGNNAVLRIELDGSLAGPSANGLDARAPVTVRGLVINRFAGHGVVSPRDSVIVGNFIGTDTSGMVALGNGGSGIELGCWIGGLSFGDRNVVSGNRLNGIHGRGGFVAS